MARKQVRKRGSLCIALIAVLAALAGGPSAAAADLEPSLGDAPGLIASWAEE
jgi:hypothetical protein